jgi:pyridoxal phosphate enzyme (YggS family)
MPFDKQVYDKIKQSLLPFGATLVAVSKTKSIEDIREAYALGMRDFGENYVQELVDKEAALPKDIRWHFIGHLQTNKVKYIAPFVHLIHGVDSEKLLSEVSKQGQKINRVIPCLLQVHIAAESSKFGFSEPEVKILLNKFISTQTAPLYPFAIIKGMMGMASFTEDNDLIEKEFSGLYQLFNAYKDQTAAGLDCKILSMGMSADYGMALNTGSNMIRIGSMLFGSRLNH